MKEWKQLSEAAKTAAAALCIEPKRLIGFMARNSLADPIGDGRLVYGWSCKELAKRLAESAADMTAAVTSTAAP